MSPEATHYTPYAVAFTAWTIDHLRPVVESLSSTLFSTSEGVACEFESADPLGYHARLEFSLFRRHKDPPIDSSTPRDWIGLWLVVVTPFIRGTKDKQVLTAYISSGADPSAWCELQDGSGTRRVEFEQWDQAAQAMELACREALRALAPAVAWVMPPPTACPTETQNDSGALRSAEQKLREHEDELAESHRLRRALLKELEAERQRCNEVREALHACREREARNGAELWKDTAMQERRNVEYYRGLLVRIGDTFGVAARAQDDGGTTEGVLCAKVPELVVSLRRECEAMRKTLTAWERWRPFLFAYQLWAFDGHGPFCDPERKLEVESTWQGDASIPVALSPDPRDACREREEEAGKKVSVARAGLVEEHQFTCPRCGGHAFELNDVFPGLNTAIKVCLAHRSVLQAEGHGDACSAVKAVQRDLERIFSGELTLAAIMDRTRGAGPNPQLEFHPAVDVACADFRKVYDLAVQQVDSSGRLYVQCPSCKTKGIKFAIDGDDWYAPPKFDFGTALRLLKAGKKVRRTVWKAAFLELIGNQIRLSFGPNVPDIIWYCADSADQLAEDWEILP